MISIVIPLYNKERSIAKTLDCVLGQTWQDFEVVVVDDGSTDRSAEVVKRCTDPRIRLISQKNAGVSAARNRGIAEARGEWVALLDADDEWEPDYLATQAALATAYPDCSVCATNYVFVSDDGSRRNTILHKLPFDSEDGELTNYFEVAACSHPPIWTSATMARKEAFEAVGGFPLGVKSGEDLITWSRLACRYRIAYSKKAYALYNHPSQAKRLKPDRAPEEIDYVGNAYSELLEKHAGLPGLVDMAARWHKMRMVTFIQLGNGSAARAEYAKIRSYVDPSKVEKMWNILSYMPLFCAKGVLLLKSLLGR